MDICPDEQMQHRMLWCLFWVDYTLNLTRFKSLHVLSISISSKGLSQSISKFPFLVDSAHLSHLTNPEPEKSNWQSSQ